MMDSPPEALPSELDIVLQLAELVRLDRLVPRHDHLADELWRSPHSAALSSSGTEGTHLAQLSELPRIPLSASPPPTKPQGELTCLLAIVSVLEKSS